MNQQTQKSSVFLSARFWIGIAISILCLWLAFRNVPFSEFGVSLAQANYWWLLPTIPFQFFAIWTRARRWMVLLNFYPAIKDSFWAQTVGYLFTNILPLRMGEVARVVVLARRARIPAVQVASSALVERLLDVATIVVMMVIILPFMQVPEIVVRAGIGFGSIVLIAIIALVVTVRYREPSTRILRSILSRFPFLPLNTLLNRWNELVDGFSVLQNWRISVESIVWTAGTWGSSIVIYFSIMKAFQPETYLYETLFLLVALAFAVTVPSSPGFIGVFQFIGQQALVIPFAGKYTDSSALAITIVSYLLYYLSTTILGIIGLWLVGETFSSMIKTLTERNRKINLPNSIE